MHVTVFCLLSYNCLFSGSGLKHSRHFLQHRREISDLVWVWDIRTAVAGVSHFVSITILLVSVGNFFAVIQVIKDSLKSMLEPVNIHVTTSTVFLSFLVYKMY